MRLYTVTMLENENYHARGPIAVCTTQEIACGIVEANTLDIHETNHDLAVVACIGADSPYGIAWASDGEHVAEIWYRWNGTADDGQYERCAKPQSLERVVYGL